MGNKNAITYKEFFPLLRNNEVWVGYTSLNGGRWMILPKNITVKSKKTKVDADGNTILNVAGVCWFTNLDHPKRHELIDTPYLYAKRDALYPDLYPKYDNYDAINIDKLSEIPMDYEGVMGVPITFLDKYNPEQFEIVAFRKGEDGKDLVFTREREREFNRTFVSLYDVDSRDDKERRRRNKWQEYLCQNNNQAKVEPIDYFFPLSTTRAAGTMNGLLNGKETYRRILIQRKAG